MGDGVTRFSGFMAAFVVLTVFVANNAADAETTLPSLFSPVPTPTPANPYFSGLSYAAPTYDFSNLDRDKFRKETPLPTIDTVDLGKSILRVEVVDNVVTRPGDPNLADVIVPARPGKKRSTPRYFGFTITSPTN